MTYVLMIWTVVAMAGALNDITSGKNGNCPLCAAGFRYDLPTWWGTPNANVFIPVLINL